MLTFAAFTPHPPIIIPEIGKTNTKYCVKTVKAMNQLSKNIENCDVCSIIIISPHTSLHPQEMTISLNNSAYGDFSQFNEPNICIKKEIDTVLAENIHKYSKKLQISSRLLAHNKYFYIDHGVSVPLYYLEKSLPSNCEIVIIGYSGLSRNKHFVFGKALAKAINESEKNIAVIASGDLSHRLLENGSEYVGEIFDKKIVTAVADNKLASINNIDSNLQEEAGECGYRSLMILAGILDGIKTRAKVISYEAPFGVGYMIADFQISQE